MARGPGTILRALVLGFTSTTAQILLLRELLVAFTGNELTIAATLAIWLLAVATGSLFYRESTSPDVSRLPRLFIIAGLASLLQVISIRLVPPLIWRTGEMPTPAGTAIVAILGILPCAIAFGALFVGLTGEARATGFKRPVAAVYGVEALGSAVAGAVLSAFLLGTLNPIGGIAIVALICLVSGGYPALRPRQGARWLRAALLAAGLVGLLVILAASHRVDLATRRFEWRPLKVAETVDSKYGNIVITGRESNAGFYETGMLAFTLPDPLYAEECVHIPMLLHSDPHNVLILGGAGSGLAGEALKYPSVRLVDLVEMDPALMSAVKRYAPAGWLEGNARASVNTYYADGPDYVAKAVDMYDVVLVGVGAPTSLLANRYYTVEFFRQVEKLLERDGILAVKIASPGAYVGPETATLAAAVANAMHRVFPNVLMLPGDYIHIVASPGLDLKSQVPLIMERLKRRGIQTSFVNQYVLWDRLATARIAQLDSVVASVDRGQVNSAERPISFSLAIALWQKEVGGGHLVFDFISWLDPARCVLLLTALGLAITGFYIFAMRLPGRAFPSLMILYSMGLVTMFTEILTILAFQISRGYIYGRIAVIIAAYMAGMGAGAGLSARRERQLGSRTKALLFGALIIPPMLVPLALRLLGSDPRALPEAAADVTFAAIAALAGCLAGAAFSSASAMLSLEAGGWRRSVATAYSIDLFGASVAGLLTGLVVIPALGITRSAYAVAATCATGCALAAIARARASGSRPG